MGARYCARAVPAGLVEIAKIHPGAFFDDAWFLRSSARRGRQRDELALGELALGESWSDLQILFLGQEDSPRRPAFELVRGQPRFAGSTLLPFARLLDLEQVAAVAGDLATVNLDELYQSCLPHHSPDWAAILAGRRDTVAACLAVATRFTAQLTSRRKGLIYSIG